MSGIPLRRRARREAAIKWSTMGLIPCTSAPLREVVLIATWPDSTPKMNVSIIIPVFNTERYVAEAVRSALQQPETREVIVVDDGSTDQSAAICRCIAETDSRVRVVAHPDGRNHGVSAARNLGIELASSEYVAFLDADDFYLPTRFTAARQVFEQFPGTDGVCEAIGTHFESDEAEKAWRGRGYPLLTTILAGVDPDRIFESQSPIGRSGHCSLDGLTVTRNALLRVGPFHPRLAMGEDTAFFIELAACATLRLGRVDAPVTIRRVHSCNTITRPRGLSRVWHERRAMWLAIYRWFHSRCPGDSRRALVVQRMLEEALTMLPAPEHPLRHACRYATRCISMVGTRPLLLSDAVFLRKAVKQTLQCFLVCLKAGLP